MAGSKEFFVAFILTAVTRIFRPRDVTFGKETSQTYIKLRFELYNKSTITKMARVRVFWGNVYIRQDSITKQMELKTMVKWNTLV
jgi:hypothetical protein